MQNAGQNQQRGSSGAAVQIYRVLNLNKRYQKLLDDLTIYPTQRWIFTGILSVLYIIRAVTAEGWYVVTVSKI